MKADRSLFLTPSLQSLDSVTLSNHLLLVDDNGLGAYLDGFYFLRLFPHQHFIFGRNSCPLKRNLPVSLITEETRDAAL